MKPARSKPIRKLLESVRAFREGLAHPHQRVVPAPEKPIRPKLGLALGGGFARGLAHIGVLRVLEESGIHPDFIAGTSVGAVIGACYCSGVSARELTEIASLVRMRDIARYCVSRLGLCSNDRMTQLLLRICKVRRFEDLHTPLAVIATDFLTGEPAIFRAGDLIDPVRASCAYPGIFKPVSVNGRLMVDGLLAHCVPAIPVREMGAEKIISVSFNAHWIREGSPRHVLDIIGQCFSIAASNVESVWQAVTDVSIQPEVSAFAYDAFDRGAGLIEAGSQAALDALPRIQAMLQAPPPEAIAVPQTVAMSPVLTKIPAA